MSASLPSDDVRSKDPHLPPLHRVGDLIAPKAPQDLAAVQMEETALADLIVKAAYTTPRFTTDGMAKQLHLSLPLVGDLLGKLCFEGQMEQLMQTSQTSAHYRITPQGCEQAARLLEVFARGETEPGVFTGRRPAQGRTQSLPEFRRRFRRSRAGLESGTK